jgi:hypothetical protein
MCEKVRAENNNNLLSLQGSAKASERRIGFRIARGLKTKERFECEGM